MRLTSLLCLMLALVPGPAAALRTVDLDAPPARTPWVLQTPQLYTGHQMNTLVRTCLLADLDGDGVLEGLQVVHNGLLAVDLENGQRGALWQHNLEPRFLEQEPPARVGAVLDCDGDGSVEVVYVADGGASGEHRLRVWDPETREFLLDAALPVGPDARQDGRWDGRYEVLGAPRTPRPTVILGRIVGYDRYARGVAAYDLRDGRELWSFVMGNNLDPVSARLVDLEGDGSEEIVFAGTSPDNLAGEEVGGTSDDACRLFVLEADGTLRWRARLGGTFCTADLDVNDLDGDGVMEIVSATNNAADTAANQLAVWAAADGALLGRKPLTEPAAGVAAQPGADTPAHIHVGQARSGAAAFHWRDGLLTRSAAAVTGRGLVYLHRADVLPAEPGDELILVDRADGVSVFSPELELLAAAVVPDAAKTQWAEPWRLADDFPAVLLQGGKLAVLTLHARPPDARDAAPWLGAGLAVVLGGAGVAAARRRRRSPPPLPRRDLHARLLRELAQASHDKLGLTQGLDRMVTQCGYLASASGRTPELLARARDTWAEFEAGGRARLQEILDLCDLAEVPPALRARARGRLEETERLLSRLIRADLAQADVVRELPGLRAAVAGLEEALRGIRAVLESYFQADLGRVVRRVLLLREDELTRAGVTVEADLPAERVCRVRIDPVDLRFVVDNLVVNAVRSFGDGEDQRRLKLEAAEDDRIVTLTVTDNGRGVPRELHDRIFSPGYSDRGEGGLGLARSREILAGCGGELALDRSAPGEGAAFSLRLRCSRADTTESETL